MRSSQKSGLKVIRLKLLLPAASVYEKLKAAVRGKAILTVREDERGSTAMLLVLDGRNSSRLPVSSAKLVSGGMVSIYVLGK